MKAKATWTDGIRFLGRSESNFGVIMDGSATTDPEGPLGPSPMELLLLGLCGCSGIDVVLILKKMRQAVSGCEIEADGERAETNPKFFVKIHQVFTVTGHNLDPEKVEKAVGLAADKYCSVRLSLNPEIEITREIRIVEDAEAEAA